MIARTLRLLTLTGLLVNRLSAADVMDTYEWKPICLGAGGWASGIVCSETDPNVRFVRTDSGQFYRWSVADKMWLPMIVQNTDGSGFGKDIFPEPIHALTSNDGHFALDPNDNKIIYLYFHTQTFGGSRLGDSLPYNVYKSIDGGRNFKATGLNKAAGFTVKNDDAFLPFLDFTSMHQDGDIMAVDPNNSKVVYIGTGTNGMFKTMDGGNTWMAVSGGGLPAPKGANDINILPWRNGGTVVVNGAMVSKIIYAVYSKGIEQAKGDPNSIADGNVYQSTDGGQNWTKLTADGKGPAERCHGGVLDKNTGVLYVRTNGRGKTRRELWKYDGSAWSIAYNADVAVMTVDPKNSNNLMTGGGSWGISTNAGKTWKSIPRPYICSGKHPQGYAGSQPGGNKMFGSMQMDISGYVWVIDGNDAALKWKFDPEGKDIDFTPDTAGVETFCGDDLVFPKNWGGKFLVSVQDDNGMIVNNPDTFDLTNFKPRSGLCNGFEISVCPNDPNTFTFNGYAPAITTDSGKTILTMTNPAYAAGKKNIGMGCLQISRRGNWGAGEDHLVWVFTGTAWYSRDGGKTWTPSKTDLSKITVFTSPWGACHEVTADPFVVDKFYGFFTQGGFWITVDGGETWTPGTGPAGVTSVTQICANQEVQNNLWVRSRMSGIFYSTDAGATWTPVLGNKKLRLDYSPFALGKGSGKAGDAPYTVYYVYRSHRLLEPAPDEGIFRSTDAGATWDRIAIWPYGLLGPQFIGASWDTYGRVGVAINSQGFVYGKLKDSAAK